MSVLVIGAANVDIGGRSSDAFRLRDSNIGKTATALGGVGFNIARNLRLLGVETAMLTVLGEDSFADAVRREASRLGLDLRLSAAIPGGHTGTYLYLLDEQGDMVAALNDMAIYEHMTPEFFASRLAAINSYDLVVLDANLPQNSIEYLCENCTVPLICDPVSTAKAERIKNVLCKLAAFKPNALETELLTGIPITDRDSLHCAAQKLLATGLQQVYISCDVRGLYAENQAGERCLVPCPPVDVANATGGGDAMVAALAACILRGDNLKETARNAIAAGAFACTAETTIHPQMSWQAIQKLKMES